MSNFLRDRKKIFNRRLFLLGGIQFSASLILLERLYKLQIKESDRFTKLAENNHISTRLLLPPRGRILDRSSNLLAINKEKYRLVLIPEANINTMETISKLNKLLDFTDQDLTNLKLQISQSIDGFPINIKKRLVWKEVAKISENIPELPGVFIEMALVRHYISNTTSHVIGYVSKPSILDKKNSKLLSLPGSRVGKSGVELVLDKVIRGKAGRKKVEVNAHGRIVKVLRRLDGLPGSDVHLTISKPIQEYVHSRLGNERAGVVLLRIADGEILASVSTPSFNPNAFNTELSKKNWSKIKNNSFKPLFNRASMGLYPPGSVFKLVVALAALENNIIDPYKEHYCSGGFEYGNQIFHCWRKNGHGSVNCMEAISESCDVYFYDLALKVGIDNIIPIARELGLGYSYEKEILQSAEGLLPDRNWKRKTFNQAWSKSETIVAGIGQGYILSSPLQLAVLISRIASGGNMINPNIIKLIDGKKQVKPVAKKMNISQKSLSIIKEGLFKVVNSRRGTAYGSRITNKNNIMAGKTGTSQVRRITMSEREKGILKNEELPLEKRDHALFVGYAPYNNPKYAVSVVIEHGGSGSKSAAPVARDILKKANDLL